MKKVLILGGGFSGLEAAIYLSQYDFDVTLASNRDFIYIYPVSMWVLTGEKKFEDICIPLEHFREVHGFSLKIEGARSIVAKENKVIFENSEETYDYLIIATGGGKVSVSGMEQHTLTICGPPEHAVELKKRIDAMISNNGGRIALGIGDNPLDPPSLRIGPAVELLLNLHHYFKKRRVRNKFELTFFSPEKDPFAHVGKLVSKIFMSCFSRCNKPPVMGKQIKEYVKDGVIFADDSKLDSDLTIITPGVNGHPLLKNSDVPVNESGFVKIETNCQVPGFPNVFAVGDCADMQAAPKWYVRQGHNAVTMAKCAAYNIQAIEGGLEKQKHYTDHLWLGGFLDDGSGAAFLYKTDSLCIIVPLPILGHWIKKGWAVYWKLSRLNKIPRIMNF